MEIDLDRFRGIFFEEADEHLATMEKGLLDLEDDPKNSDTLNAVFRAAHSIKGASGTFGFDDISNLTHAMESLLDRMRSGAVEASSERLNLLLSALDNLRVLLEAAQTGTKGSCYEEIRTLLTVAQRSGEFRRDHPAVLREQDGSTVFCISFVPNTDVLRQGLDPALVIRQLTDCSELKELSCDFSNVPALTELNPETCYVGWKIRVASRLGAAGLRDLFAFVEDGADLCILQESRPRQRLSKSTESNPTPCVTRDSTIRVATSKVDKLIDLVGELVIAQSMAAQTLGSFTMSKLHALERAFSDIERYTRELQERVMGIRMLPIGTVFSRMPRLIHDLSLSTGKPIELETAGEETELDKSVVESLADPLMHLIRNAVDHGLEPPEEREAAGKCPKGKIRLSAYHQGGNVLVEVADDGRGLDVDKIKAKAIERGLIRFTDELNSQSIQSLIFEPGFSTADVVTGISGRGVGMDVVKRNVEALNGSVDLRSERGKGTRIRIKLPLTLAILDGLLMRVRSEVYVLPLLAVTESFRPNPSELKVIAGSGEIVIVRGQPVPVVRLGEILNAGRPSACTDGLVVLVENQGARMALFVDELLGQQQVVIKTLETNFRKVEGVIGATILGDGRAALILDVAGIVQMARLGREIPACVA